MIINNSTNTVTCIKKMNNQFVSKIFQHKKVLTYCMRNPGPGLRHTQKCVRIETGNGMLILPCLLLSQKRMAALRRQYYNRVNECS
jgi:hypothetical protein